MVAASILLLILPLSSWGSLDILKSLDSFEVIDDPLGPFHRRRLDSSSFVYEFEAYGKHYSTPLHLHDSLFGHEYKHIVSGKTTDDSSQGCLYSHSSENVTAFFSFCDQAVFGKVTMSTGDEVLIQPVIQGGTIKHIVYRNRDLGEAVKDSTCGLNPTNINDYTPLHDISKEIRNLRSSIYETNTRFESKRNLFESSTRYIELVLVNDYQRYSQLGYLTHANTAYIVGLVEQTYNNLPGPHKVKLTLVGMYTFSQGNATSNYQGWTNSMLDSSVDARQLLPDFGDWAEENKWDLAHLLSGHDFSTLGGGDNVVGLASIGGWCLEGSRFGISQATFPSSSIANIMAHEIGHNLGMLHTDSVAPSGKVCYSSENSYIMDPSTSSDPVWSECSPEWMDLSLDNGRGKCTQNIPASIWQPGHHCGNGIVEGNEECEGDNSCCDGSTCTFRSGAVCNLVDVCCTSECQYVSKSVNLVCRESQSTECDSNNEMCDGSSGKCPLDIVSDAGSLCDNEGKCFLGRCSSRDEQCTENGYASEGSDTGCLNLICATKSGDMYQLNAIFWEDGTPCAVEAELGQCVNKLCETNYSKIPTPESTMSCSNGMKDAAESDIDCGGPCVGTCTTGQTCTSTSDCIYPGICNVTKCQVQGITGPSDESLQQKDTFLNWIENNPVLASGIGFLLGAGLLTLAYCLVYDKKHIHKIDSDRKFNRHSGGSGLMDQLATQPHLPMAEVMVEYDNVSIPSL